MVNSISFHVLGPRERMPYKAKGWIAFLRRDMWDDWAMYCTQFSLTIRDPAGNDHSIGQLKIGQRGLRPHNADGNVPAGHRSPELEDNFDELSDDFFSVGQEPEYYSNLNELDDGIRQLVLTQLRDVAFDEDRFKWAYGEDVMTSSLLRSISVTVVEGQFRRMAHGGTKLTRYQFSYWSAGVKEDSRLELTFSVLPASTPPTNVQVIIGRNGVGKTRVLNNMTRAILSPDTEGAEFGRFDWSARKIGPVRVPTTNTGHFSNVVLVSFSAFDTADLIERSELDQSHIKYSYVGLRQDAKLAPTPDIAKPTPLGAPKSAKELAHEFVRSLAECKTKGRRQRWKAAMEYLGDDLAIQTAGYSELINKNLSDESQKKSVMRVFELLSSGHKIVLLTLTRLIEKVEEKTLVLIDEPEAHLHPPLLGAFIRALSNLLIDRNGVAIIATHSPVVLQEVPKDCVWVLSRVRHEAKAERPENETFGENVGSLTREVFGLEVIQSGYVKILEKLAENEDSYESALEKLNNKLGTEGKAILRAFFLDKNSI